MIRNAKHRPASALRQGVTLAALGVLAVSLGGCASKMRPTQKAFAPDEYEARHPIRIAEQVTHLDIFANGRGIDRRQHGDIVAFAKDHAQHGRSPITAAVPQGGSGSISLAAIQKSLSEGGAHGRIQVVPYAADPSRGSAPVRLSFTKVQAKVDSRCGVWPADVGSGGTLETWHNRPHHNLGCAYQTLIAAQVADPIDLVRPRAEGAVDVAKRTKDIEALRKGEDPSTKWQKDDASVKDSKQ